MANPLKKIGGYRDNHKLTLFNAAERLYKEGKLTEDEHKRVKINIREWSPGGRNIKSR
jgi:hypothetical protein